MDYIPITPYLKIPADTLHKVRKDINLEKPGEMKEAVRILDEWVKQQSHFMEKNIPLHYLEMTIVTSKGSVQRAKRVLEIMSNARNLRPENFEPCDLREYYKVFRENYLVVAMPRLTSEYYRILIVKLSGKINNNILDAVYKYLYSVTDNCLDYLKVHDYHSGVVVVFDMTDNNMQHFITHVNFFEMGNCTLTCLNAYGLRLKRCHLITPSKAIQTVLSIFKAFVTKKIMDRVVVNESAEELLQYYSRDALPKDYGGDDKTILELQDEILKKLPMDEHIQHMEIMQGLRINNSIISESKINNEDAIHGTFRSLNID